MHPFFDYAFASNLDAVTKAYRSILKYVGKSSSLKVVLVEQQLSQAIRTKIIYSPAYCVLLYIHKYTSGLFEVRAAGECIG